MQKIYKIFFISTALLFSVGSFAQTHRIDSLKKQIASSPDKKKQLDLLLALCTERNSIPSDTLYKYATIAKEFAISLNDKIKASWADFYIAFRLLTKGMTDSSLKLAEEHLKKTYNTAEDKDLYVKFYLLKANALNRTSKTKEALDMLYTLLGEAEKKEDYFTQIYVFNYIGTAYQLLAQSKEAQKWFYKAIQIPGAAVTFRYQEAFASALLNIGITYMSMYQDKARKLYADSCEYYLTQAISLGKKNEYLSTLAYASNMKGLMLSYTNRSKEAEVILKEGLEIRKQIGDPYYIISDIIALGEFYINTKQPEKGIAICNEGIGIVQKFQVTADLPGLYHALAENYKASGDLLKYGEVLKQLVILKDSVYKKNAADQLAEMQTRYDVQKKENTIIRQKYDLSKKNYFIYGIAGILAATLLLGYVFFRNRKKTQLLKLQQIEAEQKQKTTRAVMQAEEEERKRIAGDLHDSVAQKMVVAKMNLESLGNRIKEMSKHEQEIYHNISSLLEESTVEVRNLSHSMMPQAFTHSGLTDAVKDFLDKIPLKDLEIGFSTEGDFKKIPEDKALMIYRIIQECVQNALKHAKATKLDIAMIASSGEVDVTVEDNGIGFDTRALDGANSLGLKNIRSRIEYMNGKLDINSEPGNGTVIAFYIPIH